MTWFYYHGRNVAGSGICRAIPAKLQVMKFAATAPELAGQSGTHLAECAVTSTSPEGQDAEVAERLWTVSAAFVAAAGEPLPA